MRMTSTHRPLISSQPWKAVYIIYYFALTVVLLPFWIFYYVPRSLRPHSKWTYQQALRNLMLEKVLHLTSAIRLKTDQALKPGIEKDRFFVIKPTEDKFYQGVVNDSDIRPAAIGAIWHPEPCKFEDKLNKTFIIHFHGGAYVTGSGRDVDTGFAANLLASTTSSSVLIPQYRLSSNPGGQFPAALQDSITAYRYLLHRGIPASRIAISGDSAGGNLVIALLRYISETENQHLLPSPAAALLWSPWLDLHTAAEPQYIQRHVRSKTDYIPQNFLDWGLQTFIPKTMKNSDPYLSPLKHPFTSKTAIWMQAGALEILYDDIIEFSRGMETIKANNVALCIEPYANHDILLTGEMTGFATEAKRCAEKATVFLSENGFYPF